MESASEDFSKHITILKNNVWLVPCTLDPDTKNYIPLVTAQSNHPTSARKWLEAEDNIIYMVVEKHGQKNWAKWATKINDRIHAGISVRSSK
jgi:hypothetical protein